MPQPVANVVTTSIAKSLRSYFVGVTIIAALNAVLIGALQQVIQPVVMGATLGLKPLVVLFGMVGLTLAVPLTSAAVHISNELRAHSNEPAVGDVAPASSG